MREPNPRGKVLVLYAAPSPPLGLYPAGSTPGICTWCSGELGNPDGTPLRGRARCWPDREGRACDLDHDRSRVWNARDALRGMARHEGRSAIGCVDCGLVVEELRPYRRREEGGFVHMVWAQVAGAPRWEADHEVPLWAGGEHAVANLRVRCVWCHREKTAREAGLRAGSAPAVEDRQLTLG